MAQNISKSSRGYFKYSTTLFVLSLFLISLVLGIITYKNFVSSGSQISEAIKKTKATTSMLTLDECGSYGVSWFQQCKALEQICSNAVPQITAACVRTADRSKQCEKYGDQILGYNFGLEQCKPYLKPAILKKACADSWQIVADYCKKFKS